MTPTCNPDPKKWNVTPSDLESLGREYGVEHLLNSIDKIYDGGGRYETRVAVRLYETCNEVIERKFWNPEKDEHLAQCVDNMVFALLYNHGLVPALVQLISAYIKRLTFEPDTCLVTVLFMQIYRTDKLTEKEDTK